ncbi:Protein of unknown function [Pyronema omphalodes CBS 100304]|uniref:Uncharacterized protein n=1 Tax=Pyronema omphalodes (strain CBS 100304) TaxID=1076935 RepID=U4LSJ6_PYROM|nr:Protein of unknown function [Pyronema omphalodes CBS 100304]
MHPHPNIRPQKVPNKNTQKVTPYA